MSAEVAPTDLAPWVARIRPYLARTVEDIAAAGRELTAAKAALAHGRFGPLLDELGLSPRMAQRFMAVARHPALTDPTRASHLPAAIGALDVLARLDADDLAEAIDAGEVTPSTTREEADALVRARHPEPEAEEPEPRPRQVRPNDWRPPVIELRPRFSKRPTMIPPEIRPTITTGPDWHYPARVLLDALRRGDVQLDHDDDRELVSDLRDALLDVEHEDDQSDHPGTGAA